jgi:hypothetical protein
MAFRTYPQEPVFQSEGEKTVYGLLIDQLPDDAEVYCNIEHFDGNERREIDFLVSLPEIGLVALEVKGGHVVVENQTWKQYSKETNRLEKKDFVHQLDAEKRMLRDRFRQRFNFPLPNAAFLLVTPDANFTADALLPGLDRWQLVSKNENEKLYQKMLEAIKVTQVKRNYGVLEQEAIRQMFGDESNPYLHIIKSAQERGEIVDQLSRDQSYLLDLMADNKRIYIKGGPGSGKTILAIEQAVKLANERKRVGLLCYNRGLGEYLKRTTDALESDRKPSFVGTLDDLAGRWGLDEAPTYGTPEEKAHYWGSVLPKTLLTHTNSLQEHKKFDAWIVDEVQDLRAEHLEVLKASLRDPENGIIHVFGDQDQNLFAGAPDLPWFYAIGRLSRNLRSSRKIAESLNELSSVENQASGLIMGTSPEVIVVEDGDNSETVADAYVDYLIREAEWRPQDIVVVTTGKLHTKHQELKTDLVKYWNSYFADDSVFYTHVNAFKGLERPVVVVVANGMSQSSDAKQQLYVAMSRARDDLVIVGSQRELDSLGELVKKFASADFDYKSGLPRN